MVSAPETTCAAVRMVPLALTITPVPSADSVLVRPSPAASMRTTEGSSVRYTSGTLSGASDADGDGAGAGVAEGRALPPRTSTAAVRPIAQSRTTAISTLRRRSGRLHQRGAGATGWSASG